MLQGYSLSKICNNGLKQLTVSLFQFSWQLQKLMRPKTTNTNMIHTIYTGMSELGHKNSCIHFTNMYLCIETLTKFSYNFFEHSKAWKQFWNIFLIKRRDEKKWESHSNKNKQSRPYSGSLIISLERKIIF